ncbi:MAG TPA: TonB-dependent receptor [Candidatus Acidoferrales bacterium]|nr:TonB-dependent receptor [Candidatus Acidoferrales bacterium]
MPNAKVVAVHNQTRDASEATTSTAGLYVLPALRPGIYTLTVEASGFSKTSIKDIELVVSANVAQDVTLEVGKLTEVVEVTANAVAVTTTDAQVAAAVTLKDIDTLPQLARTPITLGIFQPGVQISQNGSNAGADTSYSRVNGLRQGSNNSTLDGIDVNDAVAPRYGLSLTANNTDSVEEFRVVTEGGKAEYGRNAGGQVELVTRSGTNFYHGSLFDYIRNQALNANDFFSNKSGVAKAMFIQNIFGGSMGGPIKKNKLFIFGNYQGRRTHQMISRNRTVPTDLAKQGIFQYVVGGAVQQYNILNADPLHKGIDPIVASLLKNYPSPNNNDVGDGLNYAGYRFNNPNNSLEDQFTIKADYNLKDNHHVFARVSWQRNSAIDSLNSADASFPGQPQGTQGGRRWGVAGGWDWTVSSTIVNEFRYGHQSASVSFLRPARVDGPMYLFNLWTNPILTNFAQGRNSPVNEYTDNLTKIKGNHTFKMGGNIRFTTQWGTNDAGIYPNESLSYTLAGNTPPASANPPGATGTALTTFQGMYDNLLGRVGSIAQTYYSDLSTWQAPGTPRVRNFIFHEYGFFVQDDWKVSHRLTLNLGLRYDFSGVPSESNGFAGALDQSAQINTVSQISNFTIQKGKQWYNNDWNNFAPRIGFAWDPWGDGKTAIRGNYGMFYDRIIGATTSSVDGSTPGFSSALTAFPNQAAGSDVRASDKPAPPAQPAAPVLQPLPNRSISNISIFDPNLRTGYVEMWGFNIQRTIVKDTVLQAGYVGNRGLKLFFNQDMDQVRLTPSFIADTKEIANNLNTLGNVSPNNQLVKIFGSASAAVSALGASNFQTNQIRNITDALDQSNNSKYAAAGLSQFYLRNYPQFFQLYYGTNAGLSWYNSLQASIQHKTKSVQVRANYTFSKSMDNTNAEGNGSTDPIDSFNLNLNKGRSDFDRAHVFNFQGIYTLPIGKGHTVGGNMPRWADAMFGGWDVGGLMIWESGSALTASSGRFTMVSYNTSSWLNYTGGDRNIGGVQRQVANYDGVYFYDPNKYFSQFAYPGMADYGNAGRNTFRGPRFFNVDFSLVKSFAITEHKRILFRAEAYNLFNNVNFANPVFTLTNASTFGKISNVVSNPRLLQGALRFEF